MRKYLFALLTFLFISISAVYAKPVELPDQFAGYTVYGFNQFVDSDITVGHLMNNFADFVDEDGDKVQGKLKKLSVKDNYATYELIYIVNGKNIFKYDVSFLFENKSERAYIIKQVFTSYISNDKLTISTTSLEYANPEPDQKLQEKFLRAMVFFGYNMYNLTNNKELEKFESLQN